MLWQTLFGWVVAGSIPQYARCADVALAANIGPSGREITVEATCRVATSGQLFLGDYAALLDDVATLDEQGLLREYPDGFCRAATQAAEVRVLPPAAVDRPTANDPPDGHLKKGWRPLAPITGQFWRPLGEVEVGQQVTVRWRRQVPNRQGNFGWRHHTAYLLGGWHPVFGGAHDGRVAAAVVPIDYVVTLPEQSVALVGQQPVGRTSPRQVRGRHLGTTVPVVVARAAKVQPSAAGVLWIPEDGRGRAAGHDDLSLARDRPAHAATLRALALARAHVGQTLAALGGDANALPQLLVVQAPLRHHLAEAFEGGVTVSDRAFHVPRWPAHVADLHRASLWREALTATSFVALRQRAAAAEAADAPPQVPTWTAADAVGASLRGQLLADLGGVRDSAELLGGAVATPELDALIYAPQVAFAETYLMAVDESVGDRRRLETALTGLPRGKLLWEKARDRWPLPAVSAAFAAFLPGAAAQGAVAVPGASTSPPAHRAAAVCPTADFLLHLGRRCGPAWPAALAPWLGPYPTVDYALGAPLADAASGLTVEVIALTETRLPAHLPSAGRPAPPRPQADGDSSSEAPRPSRPLLAPVDVLVVEGQDAKGVRHRASRVGPGSLHLPGALPFAWLRLDPGRRLAERSVKSGVQPGLNNRRPQAWRLLVNDVSALISATDSALAASIDVGLRRLYDLRFDFDFAAAVGPGTASFQVAAAHRFGRPITGLRLADSVSLTLATARLRAEPTLPAQGQQLGAALQWIRDTRLSRYLALRGYGLRLQANVAGRHDGGWRGPYGNVGAAALGLLPIGGRQALVGRLRADVSLGAVPPQTMLRLGGRNVGLRGFEMREVRGVRRLLASGEWRHVLVGDARTDVFGLLTLTRVEGALFADAALLPPRWPKGCGRNHFYDVGYGVRILGDWLGVAPASLAIDVGLPLGRCRHATGGRRPVTVYVDFVQSFSSF